MTEEKTQREINQNIWDTYDGSDALHPQVILRNVKEVNGDILDDELFGVKLSCYRHYEYLEVNKKLPDNFKWATDSIVIFMKEYKSLLSHPTERIHLAALAKNGCRIIIEDKCSSTRGNGKSHRYAGQSSIIKGKPVIKLVAHSFPGDTLLHEAIHNSDLRMKDRPWHSNFSEQLIYQAAIMMLDAQKVQPTDGYKTVEALRHINKSYQDGEIYSEGLAWIASMPMEDLAKEKNHIGKNLKILHALYTEAILKKQTAVTECFRYWKPSEHIKKLLETYNKHGQKIGKERDKILKQQKHFWEQMLKFRKEINKLKMHCLETATLSGDKIYFCETHGVNSLIPAYMAHGKVNEAYEQIEDAAEMHPEGRMRMHAEKLNELFANIKPNDLNNPALFAEKFLACRAYLQNMSPELPQDYAERLFDISGNDDSISGIAARKNLYDNLKARVKIAYTQAYSECANRDCLLAYLYGTRPELVVAGYPHIRLKMGEAASVEQKRKMVEELINTAQGAAADSPRVAANAVFGVECLLHEYNLPTNIQGILQAANLRDFNISKKVVDDLQWVESKENKAGLPTSMYKFFEAGILNDYCTRPASAFNPQSEDYLPNNYISSDSQAVAHTRALYEFMALRHAYQAKTHCKKFPPNLQLKAFKPDSDYYRQIRFLASSGNMSVKGSHNNNRK